MTLDVRLVPIDEGILRDLLDVATSEAAADEVTPPLTPGPAWTADRRAWFLAYHRDRRRGLEGPAAESTWAVVLGDRPVGAVRLQRGDHVGTVEAGIWLARSARGRGAGTAALEAVCATARAAGFDSVVADTAAANRAAQAALRRVGFRLGEATPDGRVRGVLDCSGGA